MYSTCFTVIEQKKTYTVIVITLYIWEARVLDYNNFRKVKITKQVEQKCMDNDPAWPKLYKNEKENKLESLIIDDNTIYEIDLDCFERAKRNRMNQRVDRPRR